jgi:hypothetical protein
VDADGKKMVIQHTCAVDGFQWAEAPIIEHAMEHYQPDIVPSNGPAPLPVRPPH